MKNTRRLMVLGLVLAMVVSAAGIAQADILGKKDAEDAFKSLQKTVREKDTAPLKKSEVTTAKANAQNISGVVTPITDTEKTLKGIRLAGKGIKEITPALRAVPYIRRAIPAVGKIADETVRVDEALLKGLKPVSSPAKYLKRLSGIVEKSMNSTQKLYYVYTASGNVEDWSFPEYAVGGGMDYSCFADETGDFESLITRDLSTVNPYLSGISGAVTGFNTNYKTFEQLSHEFENTAIHDLNHFSDTIKKLDDNLEEINQALNKGIKFTIDPEDILDKKVKTTIDFVPNEAYTHEISYDFHIDTEILGHRIDETFTLKFSVKDIVHGGIDYNKDMLDSAVDQVEGAVPDLGFPIEYEFSPNVGKWGVDDIDVTVEITKDDLEGGADAIKDKILDKAVNKVVAAIDDFPYLDDTVSYTFDKDFRKWGIDFDVSYTFTFNAKDVLEGSADVTETIIDELVDYVWEHGADDVWGVDKGDVRDALKEIDKVVNKIDEAVDWIEDEAEDLQIDRGEIRTWLNKKLGSAIDGAVQGIEDAADTAEEEEQKLKDALESKIKGSIDDAAEDLKEKADQWVKDHEKHWDVEVSVRILLNKSTKEIERRILLSIPSGNPFDPYDHSTNWRESVREQADLEKYVDQLLGQIGELDPVEVELTTKTALGGIKEIEDQIMKAEAQKYIWIFKLYGMDKFAQQFEDAATDGIDPLLDELPTAEEILPPLRDLEYEFKEYTRKLQAPIGDLKDDTKQIVDKHDIPTINPKDYENSDLWSLNSGDYKGKCQQEFWD